MVETTRGPSPIRFGVYVHFPYCRQRCTYCDFAIAVRKEIPHERYRDQVLAELSERAALFSPDASDGPRRSAVSVYFGGGTPSLWSPACIAQVISSALGYFPPVAGDVPEITLEADPFELCGESGKRHLEALVEAGVNRISLGIQSLQDPWLSRLGRKHKAQEALQAMDAISNAGIHNLSVDLLIGLPGQEDADLLADLHRLLTPKEPPQHLSLYQLTVETGTPLSAAIRKGKALSPNEGAQARAYEQVRATLLQAGFVHYEISSFAREPHWESVHNKLYWTSGEYLGLGVSAHSHRRLFSTQEGERFANPRSTDGYLGLQFGLAPFVAGPRQPRDDRRLALYEQLSEDALRREALWLGLRQVQGLSRSAYEAMYGIDPLILSGEVFATLAQRGLVCLGGDRIRLSDQGLLFADEVGTSLL